MEHQGVVALASETAPLAASTGTRSESRLILSHGSSLSLIVSRPLGETCSSETRVFSPSPDAAAGGIVSLSGCDRGAPEPQCCTVPRPEGRTSESQLQLTVTDALRPWTERTRTERMGALLVSVVLSCVSAAVPHLLLKGEQGGGK